MRKLFLFIVFTAPFVLSSQKKYEFRFTFEGIGDNREYFNHFAYPQTIMGSRTAFELGYSVDGHAIRGGLSELYEFGSYIGFQQPKWTFYYTYSDEKKEFTFGSFPRRGRISFPLAMLTDTLLYYRPNIEGFFSEVRWEWGHENGFVDWISRQTDTKREQFMAGLSGEIGSEILFAENYILLYHHSKPAVDIPDDHIKDYLGYSFLGGMRTRKNSSFQGYLKAGLMTSYYTERSVTKIIKADGLYVETWGRYKNYGIKSTLHTGGNYNFALGDRFYRASDYWRTDLIWYFINHKNVKATFNLSYHVINWNDLNQQQQVSVIYQLGNK